MNERKSLTARELIAALGEIDPETVITWHEWDSEHMLTYVNGIGGVNADGVLQLGGHFPAYYDTYDEEVAA